MSQAGGVYPQVASRVDPGTGEAGGDGPDSRLEQVRRARMVFIVGRGRSGTTLLRRMLDAHPQISVPLESLFVMNLRRAYGAGVWNQSRADAFFRDLWLERRMENWGLDRPVLQDELRQASAAGAEFPDLCRLVYARYASQQGKEVPRWLGDKNPHYALFVPELMATFPEARFVHLVRDYRANIVSYQGVGFDLNHPGALAWRWLEYNRRMLGAAGVDAERHLRLRHEDLVRGPQQELERICAFLEVPYDPAMLAFGGEGASRGRDWHRHLEGPLNPALLEEWKARMPERDRHLAEAICGEFGRELGYVALEGPPVPLGLSGYWGIALGWINTVAERALFRFPLRLRSSIIALYRSLTR